MVEIPFWLSLGLGLLGLYQNQQAQRSQEQALTAAQQGGLSDEELAEMERGGTSALKSNLAQRGLLDSSLFTGGLAKLRGELATAKARGRRDFQGTYIQALLNRAQQPSFLGSLVPLMLQYGQLGPGGQQWIQPWRPQGQGT